MHPRRTLHRFRALFSRRASELSMDAEMRYHIECEAKARIAAGMAPDEALRTAQRDFGGIERHKEAARDQRGFRVVAELALDSRHALRVLRRNPGYAIAAVLTFALGIGLSTAIFSVVHGVLLRPLPYQEPDRLAVLWERNAARAAEENVVSVPNFDAWRERNRSFAMLAALVPAPTTFTGPDPERVMGADVSPGYFHLLGMLPVIGRDFSDADVVNEPHSVILSDGLWRRRFGADRGIIGRQLSLDEKPFTVIGIMPPDFDPPRFGWLPAHELWTPFASTPSNRSWGRFLLVVGRLKDGVSLDAARRDIAAIADARAREDPGNRGWSANVVGLAEQITGHVRRPLLVLFAAVGFLLLMAATNVGSLTLGFLRRREPELAVRRAIGAGTGRLFRQILAHGLVLGAIGAAAGVVAAIAGIRAFIAMLPADVPRASSIRVDGTVLLFAAGIAMIATAAFGVLAALRGSRPAGGGTSSGTSSIARLSGGRTTARVGSGSLVVAEIALGVVLTVLAGLMVRSFVNLRSVDLGFEATSVVAARVSLPGATYGTPDRQRAFFDAFGDRLRGVPGVTAVSFATTRPFGCCAPATSVTNPAEPLPSGVEPPTADVRYADSSFFSALRVRVIAGSVFASRERADSGAPARVVINQILAKTLWRSGNPVGRVLHVEMYNGLDAEVVGVVGDVHLADSRTPPRATVYLSAARYPSTVRDVIVRADGDPEAIVTAIRTALHELNPGLPLYLVSTLRADVDRSLAQDRFTTMILTVFALVSLLLAAVGIYGVFAAEVTARHKEIGVRLALGARAAGVLALVLRRALALAALGAAIGMAAGLLLSGWISALLYGVGASDPLSFAGVAGLLLVVALLATLIPALRAAHISPLDAIRSD